MNDKKNVDYDVQQTYSGLLDSQLKREIHTLVGLRWSLSKFAVLI